MLLVRKSLKKENPLFNDMFTLLNTNHDYISRAGFKNILDAPPSQSTHYGENAIRAKEIIWLAIFPLMSSVCVYKMMCSLFPSYQTQRIYVSHLTLPSSDLPKYYGDISYSHGEARQEAKEQFLKKHFLHF